MENVPHYALKVEESADITQFKLKSNGLRVLVYPDHTAPVVSCMITYHVGSRNETPGLTGATHFLEHLMFKGTDRFNKQKGTSIFNVLQAVGARVNATTWLDRTNYYAVLPVEHCALALEIEADRMRGALLSPEDVESERTVILNEYDRGDNQPIRRLSKAIWQKAFEKHPYRFPTIGLKEDIEEVTAEGLRYFYNQFYWPANATLSLIGDLKEEQALDLAQTWFGALPSATRLPDTEVPAEPLQKEQRRTRVEMPGELGTVALAFKSPPATHPDTDALDVLARVMGYRKNSRLFKSLTNKGYTSGVSVYPSRFKDPGLMWFYAWLAPGANHEAVENILWDEITLIKEHGITEEEIKRAQNQIRAEEAFSRDGPYAVAARLNESIAAGDWKLFTTYGRRIRQVTRDDVVRVARTYLGAEQCTIGYYVPTS